MREEGAENTLSRKALISNLQGVIGPYRADWLINHNFEDLVNEVLESNKWEKEYNYKPEYIDQILIQLLCDKECFKFKATYVRNEDGVDPSLQNQNTWGERSWEEFDTEDIRTLHDGYYIA